MNITKYFGFLQLMGQVECSRNIYTKADHNRNKNANNFNEKCNFVAHFWVVKMACVMACYQPTWNCYSFSFKKFLHAENFDTHQLDYQG